MSKQTAFLSVALLIGLGALAWYMAESMVIRPQVNKVNAEAKAVTPENKLNSAIAKQFAQNMAGLQNQLAKAGTGNRRAQVMAAQRTKDDAGAKQKAASNRVMIAAWYADDVAERLKKSGMKLETSKPDWQGDAEGINRAGLLDYPSWGLMCKPEDGRPFLVIRVDNAQPKRNEIALATCQAAGLNPHRWGNFILGFADDAQREKVLALLPPIN